MTAIPIIFDHLLFVMKSNYSGDDLLKINQIKPKINMCLLTRYYEIFLDFSYGIYCTFDNIVRRMVAKEDPEAII